MTTILSFWTFDAQVRALPPPAPPSRTVLVIDDDPLVRRALRRSLTTAGFVVAEAANRAQAETAARLGSPDAIVCDVQLPGDDGIELVEWLRQAIGQPVPALFVSGGVELAPDRPLPPRSTFLRKPASSQALRGALKALLSP